MAYPKILDKQFRLLQSLDNRIIASIIKDVVRNGMTKDMLVGSVADILLSKDCINEVNDTTYNFKKALLIRVKIVIEALKFTYEKATTVSIDKDGTMYTHSVASIINKREKKEFKKIWFNDAVDYQDYITLKGSNKTINNKSSDLLQNKSEVTLRIKEIEPEYLDMYAILLYEANKLKVNEPDYLTRLLEVSQSTKDFMGYEYNNYRKLDSNSRNYPLNRYGFAVEYGDSFEKFLIEPAQQYKVDKDEINGAIKYLEDEFNTKDYKTLVLNAIHKLNQNARELEKYQAGKVATFTITHKELGKLLHIVDVFDNIINNLNGLSRSCVSYDFTNSGGINASNQFGDEKFLETMNLLGHEDKFDTHQKVADHLGMERDDAKGIMQGPNHGGQVPAEHKKMVTDIFGSTYKYINMTALYGKELAETGIKTVTITRPDGVRAVWYPYSINCQVPMEDGSAVHAVMPYGGNGTNKVMGLAVSLLHSSDAFTENYIQSKLKDEGIHIKTTLDNFYGRPSIKAKVVKYTFESLEILRGQMEKQLKAIEKETGIYRGWNLPDRTHKLVVSDKIM